MFLYFTRNENGQTNNITEYTKSQITKKRQISSSYKHWYIRIHSYGSEGCRFIVSMSIIQGYAKKYNIIIINV